VIFPVLNLRFGSSGVNVMHILVLEYWSSGFNREFVNSGSFECYAASVGLFYLSCFPAYPFCFPADLKFI
jgi:hypothetical protein